MQNEKWNFWMLSSRIQKLENCAKMHDFPNHIFSNHWAKMLKHHIRNEFADGSTNCNTTVHARWVASREVPNYVVWSFQVVFTCLFSGTQSVDTNVSTGELPITYLVYAKAMS